MRIDCRIGRISTFHAAKAAPLSSVPNKRGDSTSTRGFKRRRIKGTKAAPPEHFIVDLDVAHMIQSCTSKTARPRACGGGRERNGDDGNG